MSGAHIRTRSTRDGKRRYDVRFRRGGRGYPVEHAGTFKTQAEARARRDLIAGELAAGRDPRILLGRIENPAPIVTVADLSASWLSSRVDVKDSTSSVYGQHVARILVAFGARPVDSLTAADVRGWITELLETMQATSVRNYVGTLKQILDMADGPNVARDKSVKLPRVDKPVLTPPSSADVELILSFLGSRWHLPLRVLEQTGMRVGEVEALEWQDVDVRGTRFRIRQGKTRAARRWVKVPEWVMRDVADTCPPDDRSPERRVFPLFERKAAANAMLRACRAAGIPSHSPHSLRHRYASIQLARGVPVADVSAQIGHARQSITLDRYSHVMVEDE